MIVVSFKRLMISLAVIISITLILLACGLGIRGGEHWYLKIEFQNFLYWGIVALILQIWIAASILFNHRKIMKSINRLSEFENLNSSNAEKTFKEMGGIGEEIKTVLKKINQVSVMRADRISALNNLTNLLCEGYSEPVAVTDVKGAILAVSEKLKTRIAKEAGNLIIHNITDIRPDIKLSEILGFIEKERSAWTSPENSKFVCSPVFDKNRNVQFCIWEFETSFFAEKLKELNKPNLKKQTPAGKIRKLINPFRKAK